MGVVEPEECEEGIYSHWPNARCQILSRVRKVPA